MIDGQLIARKANDDPPGYRVIFDDGTGPLEVGSISARTPFGAKKLAIGGLDFR